jgi:hypothetical protein
MAPNSWRHKGHEASFVLRTHNCSLTSIPPLYLTLFARCMCTDTHFVCKKNAKIIQKKNFAQSQKKNSRPGDWEMRTPAVVLLYNSVNSFTSTDLEAK